MINEKSSRGTLISIISPPQSHSLMTSSSNSDYKAPRRRLVCSSIALAILANPVRAFQPSCGGGISAYAPPSSRNSVGAQSQLYSSVGDGPPSPPPGDDADDGSLDDFLTPKEESESLQRAREYMSETSLPISFDASQSDDEDDDENVDGMLDEESTEAEDGMSKKMPLKGGDLTSSALVGAFGAAGGPPSLFGPGGEPSAAALAKNPYMQVVSKLTPSELIAKFTASSSPRVQGAVRTTVLGLIGSLPKMAFDTTTITTGQRLASLMFQLQMTGYMLKNADYRLSLSQSLGVTNGSAEAYSSNLLLTGDSKDMDKEDPLTSGKVKGKIKVRYVGSNLFGTAGGKSSEDDSSSSSDKGVEIEVDAAAYMSELRSEVSRLKEELGQRSEEKEEAMRKDLLLYIRTLPAQELRSLTNTMSQDVLVCMKGLVQAVLGGIGDGKIGPETVTEQSGEAMAQLCMWQLAVGYNLRELEVREEMKKSLQNILEENFEGGLDGTLE
jgi:hypothetical protein